MNWLLSIMEVANSWSGCWWENPLNDRIINHAVRLGLVRRISTTQLEWTERGCEIARKYLARTTRKGD